jgi:hypothetical protein
MNAPAEAFRCQALAKEIATELRPKYDLKSSMLAGQRVLITKFDHDLVQADIVRTYHNVALAVVADAVARTDAVCKRRVNISWFNEISLCLSTVRPNAGKTIGL